MPQFQKKTIKIKRQKGGKAGKLIRILDINDASTVGAGGYGIVVRSPRSKETFKLLYDIQACEELRTEARLQEIAYRVLKRYLPEVGIPKITYVSTEPILFQSSRYLCGIGMKYLEPPLDFDESVHILLGYNQDDIDTSWGRRVGEPVSPVTNPTRGFFASPETAEWIWKAEGSEMTIEKLTYLMGRAYSLLIKHSIIPVDLEWVWSEGKPWIIDWGLCIEGVCDKDRILEDKSSSGLGSDFYIPHKGDRGYSEFLEGFFQD